MRIDYRNVNPAMLHNFDQYSPREGIDVGPYDFGSIVHYHATACSHNGLPGSPAVPPPPAPAAVGTMPAAAPAAPPATVG